MTGPSNNFQSNQHIKSPHVESSHVLCIIDTIWTKSMTALVNIQLFTWCSGFYFSLCINLYMGWPVGTRILSLLKVDLLNQVFTTFIVWGTVRTFLKIALFKGHPMNKDQCYRNLQLLFGTNHPLNVTCGERPVFSLYLAGLHLAGFYLAGLHCQVWLYVHLFVFSVKVEFSI